MQKLILGFTLLLSIGLQALDKTTDDTYELNKEIEAFKKSEKYQKLSYTLDPPKITITEICGIPIQMPGLETDHTDLPRLHKCVETIIQENNLKRKPPLFITESTALSTPAAATPYGILYVAPLLNIGERISDKELEALTAHELYHFENHHTFKKNTVLLSTIIGMACAIATRKPQLRKKFVPRITKIAAPAIAAGFCANFWVGRYQEIAADKFALRAGKAEGFISLFTRHKKLATANKAALENLWESRDEMSENDKLELYNSYAKIKMIEFLSPHPSLDQRIKMAQDYQCNQADNSTQTDNI